MSPSPAHLLDLARSRWLALAEAPSALTAGLHPGGLQAALLPAILAGDWAAIEQRAAADLQRLALTAEARRRRQEALVEAAATVATLPRELDRADWMPPAARPEWPEILAVLHRDGVADAAIERVRTLTAARITDTAQRGFATASGHLDGFEARDLATELGATLAHVVARYNLLVPDPGSRRLRPDGIRRREVDLQSRRRRVWSALRQDRPRAAAIAATRLADWAGRTLVDTVAPVAASLTARRHREPSAALELSIDLADLARDLLLALALGRRVGWLAGWGGAGSAWREWTEAADDLPFTPITPEPHALLDQLTVLDLSADPHTHDGRAVSVTGLLGPVTVEHRGPKVVSRALLVDRHHRSGPAITVVLAHIKLDSGGLVEGAGARVTGTWRESSPEVGGPALALRRRRVATAPPTDWGAWVEHHLGDLITLPPHHLDASWSWEPGPDGAINPVRHGTWLAGRGVPR